MKVTLKWLTSRIETLKEMHTLFEKQFREADTVLLRSSAQMAMLKIGAKLKAYKEVNDYVLVHETTEDPVTVVDIRTVQKELEGASDAKRAVAHKALQQANNALNDRANQQRKNESFHTWLLEQERCTKEEMAVFITRKEADYATSTLDNA